RMVRFVEENKTKRIIKESALLFEAKLDREVDKIIVVAASEEQVIDRVMKRDRVSREDVIKRIKSQIPPEEKIKKVHFVVYNDETELLIPQVLRIHESIGS